MAAAVVAAAAPLLVAAAESHPEPLDAEWQRAAPLPVPRTEVAATTLSGGRIVVVGGFLSDGSSSRRADVYSPARNAWSRAADLPVAVSSRNGWLRRDRTRGRGGGGDTEAADPG